MKVPYQNECKKEFMQLWMEVEILQQTLNALKPMSVTSDSLQPASNKNKPDNEAGSDTNSHG